MLRSPFDREIVRLAVPALGALAAEPLYLLVDTAIVGHLGTPELASLAVAGTVLTTVVALCIFLTYGTTAQVARLHGAGQQRQAAELAPQALWLAIAVGALLVALLLAFAGPAVRLFGADDDVAEMAARYLRIGAFGVPMALLALAGQGWLRGVGDLRTPLIILVAANVANVILEVVLVYGFDLGLDGSAAGTVVAQVGMGAAFVVLLARASTRAGVSLAPSAALIGRLLRMGGALVLRTGALLAAFALATAVAARDGEASLAAHQIAMQLFFFLALTLDAIAIAGQVLVGRMLGAGDTQRAFDAARRMLTLSVGFGCLLALALLATTNLVPGLFTGDDAVVGRAQDIWPLFALMQPAAAAVFAFDGILIGAGDARYLAGSMLVALAAFAPVLLALGLEQGITGVWIALLVLMAVRLITTGLRFRSRRWAVAGPLARSPA